MNSGCWNWRGCEGTTGNILSLFWCSIYNAASYQVCSHARWEDAEARCNSMARQHWLVRWKVRSEYNQILEPEKNFSKFLAGKAEPVLCFFAGMVWEVVSSYPTRGKSLMQFTLAVYQMQLTRKLKCLDLRSPLKLRECLQKSWFQWTLLVALLFKTIPLLYCFCFINNLSFFNVFSFEFSNIVGFCVSVVRQEGLQGNTAEAWWLVQEELWYIHHLQDWQGQQAHWRDPCSWTHFLKFA